MFAFGHSYLYLLQFATKLNTNQSTTVSSNLGSILTQKRQFDVTPVFGFQIKTNFLWGLKHNKLTALWAIR